MNAEFDRHRVVASIAHAQCGKLLPLLDQSRDYLVRGSTRDVHDLSEADHVATSTRVSGVLARIATAASFVSTLGLDAEIGEVDISKCIRRFWGVWTPSVIAKIESVLRSPDSASFQRASELLASLISQTEAFNIYLRDVKNGSEHDVDVLRFLHRHLQKSDDEYDQRISLPELHGLGYQVTLHGIAQLLNCSPGNARRVSKKLGLRSGSARGANGAILYNIETVVNRLREEQKAFTEIVSRKVAENDRYFTCQCVPSSELSH